MRRVFCLFLIIINMLTGCNGDGRKYIITELPEQKKAGERALMEEIMVEGMVTSVLSKGAGGQFIISSSSGPYIIMNLPGLEVRQGERVRVYGTLMGPDMPTPQINALIINIL